MTRDEAAVEHARLAADVAAQKATIRRARAQLATAAATLRQFEARCAALGIAVHRVTTETGVGGIHGRPPHS